jgi:hypothetical protein
MKVRSVIIDSLNLDLNDADVTKLSQHIEKILQHKRNPIILINEHGDELLRRIPKLLDCDLVYSQRSERPYEGLFTGLHGAGTCSFYIPLQQDYGAESSWEALEKALLTLPYMHNTHIITHKAGGPWLITPPGVIYLKKIGEAYDLEKDPDLNKLEVE